MNSATADALIAAALDLFARHGFEGASVRAISSRAGANLGAITYHFGSKRALYEAVIESVAAPARERLAAAAARPGSAIERIESMLREFFAVLHENPHLPQLILQQLASSQPLAATALRTMRANIGTLASLIAEGQKDGTIRAGEPQLMALSIAAQPIWVAMARRALQEGVDVDQADPATRAQLVDSVVSFVRAGLRAGLRAESEKLE